MEPLRQLWLLAFLATAIYTTPAAAQATVSGTEDEPREVVAERAAAAEIDPVLSAFLRGARLGAWHEDFSLDLLRTPAGMAILDPSGVGRHHALDAGRVEAARAALDDKITISTTAVVIGLLVLLVVLVAD